ncbi:hypothetical protein [Hyphomicrobium sp. MC1]|uniref:hypothetical protein n=1 Tax=Hyphomicrobium sp. (strain MC1) TaxID=717785 RepID=UPI000213D3F6|nr:hypothetical protein [Hyphomicrobium sp. MC1]CCB67448.1 conserved membrane protein of unknown function [Hyphomicrobium sp. MC1]
MRVIDCKEAQSEHGIFTLHHQMPNNELRFRLKKVDGTAYIRTEASTQGGWQESHYHKEVRETYIVQKGWIAYAEQKGPTPRISIFREGELFTTQPGVVHNVYMPAHSVIHTVKHGNCTCEDRNTGGTEEFNSRCIALRTENEILAQDIRALKTLDAKYSEEYRHFDNLIWQVPAWATAIFALSLQGLGSADLPKVAASIGIPENVLLITLLVALSLMILCFSHVMYRFRVHQRALKAYSGAPWWKSASTYTQFMINAQAVSLFVLALIAMKVPCAIWIGLIAVSVLTYVREASLRTNKDIP